MPLDEKVIAIHIDPISWFQPDYQPLHKLAEQIRVINNRSGQILDLEWPILDYLGKVIQRSLACDTDHTDDGVPIPCKTDRDEAVRAMTMYVDIVRPESYSVCSRCYEVIKEETILEHLKNSCKAEEERGG